MNPTEIAIQLYELSDTDFAEAMVTLNNLQHDINIPVTKEDMNNFDIDEFTQWLGDTLNEIIFSKEMDEGAWWKK